MRRADREWLRARDAGMMPLRGRTIHLVPGDDL
jgi:hypothetical protein